MKIQIRTGVFETNSSSVHSCCICTEDQYDKFYNGEYWYNYDSESFLVKEDAIEYNIEVVKKNYELNDDEFIKFKNAYLESEDLREALKSVNIETHRWDITPYAYYVSWDGFWNYFEYEEWHKEFNDSNGTKMIAWGFAGHD